MKKIILLSMLFAGAGSIQAQQDGNIGAIVAASIPDANKYAGSYLEPFGKGEIMNMGRGWFNTARVHKKLGFDVTVSAQMAIVPDSKQNFVFNNSDYSTMKLQGSATSANAPTFLGTASAPALQVNTTVNGQNVKATFNGPTGIGKEFKDNVGFVAVPLPIAQLGVGIFSNTELKVRYFPKTNFSGTEVGVFGVAVQNEIGNYIPVFKRIPFVHLSALVGYNTVDVKYDLTGKGTPGTNQNAAMKVNAFTLQGIASVKLALFEVYGSVGYIGGNSTTNVNGTYNITYTDASSGASVQSTVTNPIALKYTNSGITSTIGLRLNFFFLKVFADYTLAPTYNGAGAGLAFSFR